MRQPRHTRTGAILILTLTGFALPAVADPPGLTVRILEIDRLDLCAGSVTLRAEVSGEGEARIAEVAFFVDGQLLASDVEAPYEAAWDDIDPMRDHLIRVTARTEAGRAAHDVEPIPLLGLVSRATTVDRPADWIEVEVTFTDSRGRPVTDVRREEVAVFEDGRRQEIERFVPDERPVEVVLLLDASNSTASFWSILGHAAHLFGRTLRKEDRASVVAFNRDLYEIAPLGASLEEIQRAVVKPTFLGGSTSLYDSVSQSALFLAGRDGEARRALIVVTDAADSSSHLRVKDVEDYLRETGVELHSILLYPDDDGSISFQIHKYSTYGFLRKGMRRVSRTSGGSTQPVTPASLAEAFLRIGEQIRGQYRVGYSSLSRRPAAEARDVEVQLKRLGIHQVHYRRGHSPRPVTEFLTQEIRQGKERRRAFAARAAVSLPSPGVHRAVVEALAVGDADGDVAAEARQALLEIGPAAVPHLGNATEAGDAILRRRAAAVLVQMLDRLTGSGGGALVLEELTRELGDGSTDEGIERLRGLSEIDLAPDVREGLARVLAVLQDA